jgi:hypothetical protein
MPIHFIATGAMIHSRIAGLRRQTLLLHRHLGAAIGDGLRFLLRPMLDPYRPELHYMRGPGPKWRAIHVRVRRDD